VASVIPLLLAACAYNEQLQPGVVCHQYISRKDIAQIRALLMSRPDVRQPLWGFACEHGRLIAESGGLRPGPAVGSFVTLTRNDGNWRIVKDEAPAPQRKISEPP
jgi:hypothetical protein